MRSRSLPAFLSLVGCTFFVPDTRTPADFAREIAPRCAGFTDADAALAPSSVDAVEPAYSRVQSGPADRQARLRGARVHLRPVAGVSRESIARSVECHEARVVLGTAAPFADDPYAAPGRWLDIDVDSEKDGFVVTVGSDDVPTARDAIERARRFARR
jgi:hypothetical protein